MSAVLFAVACAIFYTTADVFNAKISKNISPILVAMRVTLLVFAIWLIPLFIFFSHELDKLTLSNTIQMLSFNLIVCLGYIFLLLAFSKGEASSVGVIAFSWPGVTFFIAVFFLNDELSRIKFCAAILIIIGTIVIAFEDKFRLNSIAALFAFLCMLCWGIYFAFINISISKIGFFLPQYTASIVGVFVYYIMYRILRSPLKLETENLFRLPNFKKEKKSLILILCISIFQTAGGICANIALDSGSVAIVSPILSSSTALFFILSIFLFKEKISIIKIAAAFLTFVGIFIIAIA